MTVTLDRKTGKVMGVSPSADEKPFIELAETFASMAWRCFENERVHGESESRPSGTGS